MKNSKRVVQYKQNGQEVARFDSAKLASKELSDTSGVERFPHPIYNNCTGKSKTAYGFVWKYESEIK